MRIKHSYVAALLALCSAVALPLSANAQSYTVTDLGFDVGAVDINNLGQVVGTRIVQYPWLDAGIPDLYIPRQNAWLYTPESGGLSDITGGRYNDSRTNSLAVGINDAGEVGFYGSRRGYGGPFYCFACDIERTAALVTTDGTVLFSLNDAQASRMTEDGRLAGFQDFPENRSFLTGAHGVGVEFNSSYYPLTSTINAGSLSLDDLNSWFDLAGGASFSQVIDMNNVGQVLALADNGHSYILSPVPEPSTYALMLAGLAAVGFVTKRKRRIEARIA